MAQEVNSQDKMDLVGEHGNLVHGTDTMKNRNEHQHEGGQQQLHPSGCSSEDDGKGGRSKKKVIENKKKVIEDKIEMLTGGTQDDKKELGDQQTTSAEIEGVEKKGIVEKMKDKITGMQGTV